ncbi:MAG: putative Fe-S cluster assembly protein SufT [Gammaproteobacteria bacterium]|nr:putative Fe-S cluster assembly protein SufT [Gammaproteobacteria bacterium]MCK5498600.1 putative Fe-S cluster assembly protein SufT [Gammaproteobacteria bacterium]MCK5668287.1 putative Fe-S cluster assembly protein SufT [Gammaproteobacteria bacterium]
MQHNDPIALIRDCEAALIPDGTPIKLEKDSIVYITQALGGSYTVNINGNLARVDSKDADALGFDVEDNNGSEVDNKLTGDGSVDEELIWAQLRTCYDPEIPIDIVELGLIYNCHVTPLEEGNRVDIIMTLTAPGCGMGEFLADDVRSKINSLPNVTQVNVELTFDPPWNQTMMSDAARLQTGLY